jgi:hypothetical protein
MSAGCTRSRMHTEQGSGGRVCQNLGRELDQKVGLVYYTGAGRAFVAALMIAASGPSAQLQQRLHCMPWPAHLHRSLSAAG